MSKMIPPKGMRELGVETSRGTKVLKVGKDGLFNVSDPKLARQLKKEGLGVAIASGVIANPSQVGYTCQKCGFGSFFKKCGKCGEINE